MEYKELTKGKTMAKEDAKTAHETAAGDVANLLGFFECELSKKLKTIDWVTVAELQKVRRELIESLAFFSGIEIKDIENTLEETRM